MAETDSRSTELDDDEELRRRLLKRVGIAGGLVLALLGGLALFDALYAPPEQKAPAPVAAVAPAPPEPPEPPKAEETPTDAKAEAVPEKPEEPAKTAVAAEPERTEAPTSTLPPARPERPLTVPAHARPAMMRPGEPVAAIPKSEPAKEIAKTLPQPTAKTAPASPIARAVEATRHFLLQIGVFSNVANAEELRAKLELAGIPSQIEARVQVGPFATRQEAEAAREKLKSLGMDPGLLMAVKK